MNKKWMSLLLAALLIALAASLAVAEENPAPVQTPPPSIDIGDVPTTPPVTPPSINIEDVPPFEPEEEDTGYTNYIPPTPEISPDRLMDYATWKKNKTTDKVTPGVAVVVTAKDVQVASSSSLVSMQVGDGLHSEAMVQAADALTLAKSVADAVSPETLDALQAIVGEEVAVDSLKPVMNLPLADIAISSLPGEESLTVQFDVSALKLNAGEHTAGLIGTLQKGADEVVFSAVAAHATEDGKVSVEIPADVLEAMAAAQETMFSLLSD